MRRFTLLTVALTFSGLSGSALAQGNNPFIVADEFGTGSITDLGGFVFNMPGILAADPGPGGLPSALTYNLLGPPSLIAGDLLIQELAGPSVVLSDWVRFNPAGTAPGYAASFVFYSSFANGVDSLADTGFPSLFYANAFTVLEVDEQVFYTPAPGQPGFVDGFAVTYNFISDAQASAVPEPVSASLFVIALGVLAGWHRYQVRTRRA